MLDLQEVNFSQTQFYQDVLQKGLEQGLQAGLRQGEVDLVLRQLQRRCGVISIDRQELVRLLPVEQLEALGEALLDFTGMADLEAWLEASEYI